MNGKKRGIMKKLLIILIVLVIAIAVFAQPIVPSGTRFFKYLFDTPDSYTDQGLKGLRVNSAADALEFYTIVEGVTGNYVATIADGTGIDGTASSSGATYTPTFDPTELSALTWSDGSNSSNIWTFDVSGTDHTMTAGNGLMTFNKGVTITLDLIVSGGDITLGTTSIFSGGDTASLNNIDALNPTTEATIEDAIDTLSNLISIGTIATGVWQGTDVGVQYGGTDASSFTDGGVLLGSGTGAITAMSVLADGAIIVGDNSTDPVALAAFTSSTGDLKHEAGGLEADVSGYTDGIYGMASGATLDIDTSAEVRAAIGDETGTGLLVFATAPTFTTSIKITGADANPGDAGVIVYDNTVSGMSGGALRWYDDNSVRIFVDLETDPSDDDYVVTYDADADGFYMKADADSGGATAYDNIGNPTGAGSISFDDTETATYTSATTATDFFTIEATGIFGDISIVKIEQKTGNPTDGTLLEIITADNENDVDQLLLGNGSDDYVTFKIIEAGTFTIDVTSDGTAAVVIPDPITANGGITSSGTIEAGTLTEGGNAVWNSTETDIIDSAHYATGSIDAEHLAADIIDETKIADDGIDSEHYNDASIDAAHLAPDVISGMADVTSDDADYILIWDATDSALKKVDMGEVRGAGGGATAWDDIDDPDAAATVDFTTYTQTIDIGKSDSGGGSGLILDVTGLGAGTDDVIALKITTATNDDADYVPIAVFDDSGNDNDLLFEVDFAGNITVAERVTFEDGGFIGQAANGSIDIWETSDRLRFTFGGTDIDIIWSDGVLNLRNEENGVDAIVEIEGYSAGEKGILRVLSDGDDKYIELYHDDTDAIISSSSGDVKTANLNVTTELTIPNGTDPDVDAAGELSVDTDGGNEPDSVTLRTFMGNDDQAVLADTLKHFAFSVAEPDNLAEADFHPVWPNKSGFTFIITYICGESDIDNFNFTLKERDADGANVTTIEAVQLTTDGTAMYYDSVVFADIDHTVIEAGHTIGFDNSADDAKYVLVGFGGYFNADVD